MKHLSFQSAISGAIFLVTAVRLAGCQLGDKDIRFTEEVQLSNGEVISADRFIEAASLGEVGGPGGWESKYQSFEIVVPKRTDNPPKWESKTGLIPILLDRDTANNEWVLLATFYTCDAWYSLGRPKLPYAEFRVRDGQWQKLELSSQWLGHATNVFADINSSGEPARLTLADKRKRADPRVAQKYRLIVAQWSTGC